MWELGLHIYISPTEYLQFPDPIFPRIELGIKQISWQKRRIKQIKESFWINKLHTILAISTHQKRFSDDYN